MTRDTVVFEGPRFFVRRERFKNRYIYTVWRNEATHSVKVATYDLGDKGLARATADCFARDAKAGSI